MWDTPFSCIASAKDLLGGAPTAPTPGTIAVLWRSHWSLTSVAPPAPPLLCVDFSVQLFAEPQICGSSDSSPLCVDFSVWLLATGQHRAAQCSNAGSRSCQRRCRTRPKCWYILYISHLISFYYNLCYLLEPLQGWHRMLFHLLEL
jgi:hypothetical protein